MNLYENVKKNLKEDEIIKNGTKIDDGTINGFPVVRRSGNEYFSTYRVYDRDADRMIGLLEIHDKSVKEPYYVAWIPKDYDLMYSPNATWDTKDFKDKIEAVNYLKSCYEKSHGINESSLKESPGKKQYYLKSHHGDRSTIYKGTIDYLADHVFGYTLLNGHSWNYKINQHPKSYKSLIDNINDAFREYQHGYNVDWVEAPTEEEIEEYEKSHKMNESDIDHFIERGSVYIPVRKGETDKQVLEHLEKLGSTFPIEPTEEEKASGKYIQELVYSNPMKSGGLCWFEWKKNPDYVEPEEVKEAEENKKFILSINGKNPVEYNPKDMKLEDAKKDYLDNEGYGYNEEDIEVSYMDEAEEKRYTGDSQADEIVLDFSQAEKNMETFQRALNGISRLEYDNEISREKYDECIKKLQDLYNKRERKMNEAVELSYDDYYAFGTEDDEDAIFCSWCGRPVKPEFCYVEDEEDPNSEIYCWPCHDELVSKGMIKGEPDLY